LEVAKRSVQLDVRTHIPGRVVAYNSVTQEATISVENLTVVPNKLLERVDRNAEIPLPPIAVPGVQVAFPRAYGGPGLDNYLTFPITPGLTTGTLEIFDRSVDSWRKLGAATDPGLDHTHQLQDARFVPDFWAKTLPINAPTGADAANVVLEGAALIKIGELATEAIAKADTLIAVLDAAWAAATPIATDGGLALKSTWLVSWNAAKATIKATKGRVF
jgi:hypothetical protein